MGGPTGREATRRALLGLLLLAAPSAAQSQSAVLSVTAEGRGARVAVRLPAGARWRLSALDRPPRLVLDLGAAVLDAPRAMPGEGLVRQLRLLRGPSRLVLDLAGPVAAPRSAMAVSSPSGSWIQAATTSPFRNSAAMQPNSGTPARSHSSASKNGHRPATCGSERL
jgi:hypothetical protein